eukprot:GHVP01043960.1.p1 GENE.GHVP01043960.1~~GHVP01043960.1.p1  ORF type:complete len:156 (+),score=32.52 GHVP01043960.1:76-543(+)
MKSFILGASLALAADVETQFAVHAHPDEAPEDICIVLPGDWPAEDGDGTADSLFLMEIKGGDENHPKYSCGTGFIISTDEAESSYYGQAYRADETDPTRLSVSKEACELLCPISMEKDEQACSITFPCVVESLQVEEGSAFGPISLFALAAILLN